MAARRPGPPGRGAGQHETCLMKIPPVEIAVSDQRRAGRFPAAAIVDTGHDDHGSPAVGGKVPGIGWGSLRLLFDLGHAFERCQPAETAACPDLRLRAAQLIALSQGADSQRVILWRPGVGRVKLRAAGFAKPIDPLPAAFGGFYILARVALQQPERLGRRDDIRAKRRPRHDLAVQTMANPHRAGLHLGLVANRAAVTLALNFHCCLP